MAGPPSPVYPCIPLPATVDRTPPCEYLYIVPVVVLKYVSLVALIIEGFSEPE